MKWISYEMFTKKSKNQLRSFDNLTEEDIQEILLMLEERRNKELEEETTETNPSQLYREGNTPHKPLDDILKGYAEKVKANNEKYSSYDYRDMDNPSKSVDTPLEVQIRKVNDKVKSSSYSGYDDE